MSDVSGELSSLTEGQQIVYGGNRFSTVSAELATAFSPGDRVIVDPGSGALLHVPEAEQALGELAMFLVPAN